MASQVENAPSDAGQGLWVAIFWAVVIIAGASWYFYEAEADVLLDVATRPELVNGAVAFAGAPVANGVVRVVVFDAGTRRYLAGMSLPVDAAGRFTSQGLPRFAVEDNSHPPDAGKIRSLRVTATYYGTRFDEKAKAKDKAAPPRAVTGESTLYINSSPPLGRIFVWSMATVAVMLLVLQLWVFTGELGQRKARTLFVLMYFFTFWALALPLVLSLIVAQNKYLVDSMENSPLGLVKARTAALAETQWLINIGGTVKPPSIGQRVEVDAKAVADAAVAKAAAAAAGASAVAPAEAIAVIENPGVTIQGGVTVPFFMVLLAVFGAGINMTLKVPAIQREYEDVLSEARSTPLMNPFTPWRWFGQAPAPQGVVVRRDTAGDIRRRLIENYMYLLSAPLLVIAMYYLLQVMAAQVTQPVLVLMALATGLVSKAVIGGIIKFAEKQFPDEDTPTALRTANTAIVAKMEEAKAKQLEARESQKQLAEAMKGEARALAFAEAAKAAAEKAIAEKDRVEAAHAAGQATAAEAAAAQAWVKSATSEAESMQARAQEASAHASSAENEASAKCSEADAAIHAMQAAAGRQAAVQLEAREKAKDKQSEALAAAETTQQAAETATVKQAEAAQAMEAVQPSAGVAGAGGRAAAAAADSAAAAAVTAAIAAEASAAAGAEPADTPKPPTVT